MYVKGWVQACTLGSQHCTPLAIPQRHQRLAWSPPRVQLALHSSPPSRLWHLLRLPRAVGRAWELPACQGRAAPMLLSSPCERHMLQPVSHASRAAQASCWALCRCVPLPAPLLHQAASKNNELTKYRAGTRSVHGGSTSLPPPPPLGSSRCRGVWQ